MRKKVLIIDDEQAILKFISLILRQKNYEVLTTSQSAEAISIAHEKRPDVILMDYGLVGVTGAIIHRGLKASKVTHDIPVIYISGCAEPGILDKILETDAVGFIQKPFSDLELIGKIEKAIKERKKC